MQTYHTNITQYCFLPGGAIYKTTNGTGELLFTYTDHLGSITHITDNEGNLLAEQSFDAWGRARNPETWKYETIINNQYSIVNSRGYTGHEMLPQFGIINMNGRLYDPVLGRMLSPDNYIQMPDYTQNFNRYSYVLNNPLKYTDPDGEWVQLVIGAVMGGYSGYRLGKALGASGWAMAGYIAGGTLIGAASGGIAAEIAASGGFMANTVSIAAGTYMNSVGMATLSGGRTDVTVGFGAGSYNISQNEWNGIWNWGNNTVMQNIGYTVGVLTNVQDGFAGFNGRNDIVVEGSIGGPGHARVKSIGSEKVEISVVSKNGIGLPVEGDLKLFPNGYNSSGKIKPYLATKLYWLKKVIGKSREGSNSGEIEPLLSVRLNNVRGKALEDMTVAYNLGKTLGDKPLTYGWGRNIAYGFGNGCIHHARLALVRSGIPTLPIIFPISLPIELYARQMINYNMSYFINGF